MNLKTYLSSDPRGKIDFQKKIFQENIQPCIIIYIFVLDFCWSAMEILRDLDFFEENWLWYFFKYNKKNHSRKKFVKYFIILHGISFF